MRRGWWQKLMPALAATFVVALVLGGVALIDASEGRRYAEQNVATVTDMRPPRAPEFEQALNARLFLVRSLIALVRSNPELTQTEFEDAAGAAAEGVPGVRGLALARNAVATHFFPLAGNEQAIGHDLLADPNRRGAILEVIGKRRFLIQGPVSLLQGGEAIIGRLPVILPDGNPPQDGGSGTGPGAGKVWGLAVIIVDVATVFREAGLADSTDTMMEFAMRGRDGLGASGEVFLGRPELFAANPVLTDIVLPNGTWQLGAIPRGGWPEGSPYSTTLADTRRAAGGSLRLRRLEAGARPGASAPRGCRRAGKHPGQRAAAVAAGGQRRRLCHLHAGSRRYRRELEQWRPPDQGTHGGRSHGPFLFPVLPSRCRRQRPARSGDHGRPRARPVRGGALAPAQGRDPLPRHDHHRGDPGG